jgi:arginyl-tRNA synthetase
MSNLIEFTSSEIKDVLMEALGRAVSQGLLPAVPISDFAALIPTDKKNGDFATNIALVSSKAFKLPPRKIAEILLSCLELGHTTLSCAEVAGPGFINFFLASDWYTKVLENILQEGESFGNSVYGKGKKVMIEFVSANPTGPMHIGNARGGALGDCLAAVMECAGYDVTREFFINDAGNQIDKFGLSLEARYLQIYKDDIDFPEDGYHGEDIKVRATEFAQIHGDEFVQSPSDVRCKALIDYALPKNIEGLRNDLARYRINYDVWFNESLLHNDGELDETIYLLKEKGHTYLKDGALWYEATKFGGEKDEVLIRANGNPTYFAADIAYHRNKFAIRGYDKVINIWGADHHGHVARLKGAMDAIGLDGSKLDIVLMQLVRLLRGDEVVRVSKRTGKAISLTDLLDDIPIDAARFFFNLRQPDSHLDFDLDLAVEQSPQNPVYYVQYAHARICSILKNIDSEGVSPRKCIKSELGLLKMQEELELIRHLASFTSEIIDAAKNYDPARITRYSIDLATLFHKFYNTCRVKGEEEPLMQARLNLCLCVLQVLKNALHILKIDAPETM